MKKTFEKEFRQDHPETVGETDKDFDNANYVEWLEKRLQGRWISDEEIENEARIHFKGTIFNSYPTQQGFLMGAQWMRSQIFPPAPAVTPDKEEEK